MLRREYICITVIVLLLDKLVNSSDESNRFQITKNFTNWDQLTHLYNFTTFILPNGLELCHCTADNGQKLSKEQELQKNLKASLRQKSLAKDKQRAANALIFILVLIVCSVLYTKMWRNSQFHMSQSHMYNNPKPDRLNHTITAAKALQNFHKSAKNKFRNYKLRRKRSKGLMPKLSEEEQELLYADDVERYSFGV